LAVSVAALLVSAIFALRQLRSARTANNTVVAVELLTRELLSDWFQQSEAYIVDRLAAENDPAGGIEELPPDVRAHVYRVAWFYASLGHLVVFGAINERMVLSIVKYRLLRVWPILEPYFRRERELRNPNSMMFFTHLAFRAEELSDDVLRRKLRLREFGPMSEPTVLAPTRRSSEDSR
jgi:hypothetical protein